LGGTGQEYRGNQDLVDNIQKERVVDNILKEVVDSIQEVVVVDGV